MKNIIIERPEAQTKKQRLSQNFLTALFWLLFFYLIRPFLSLFAWLLGFEIFYDVMIEKHGYRHLVDLIGIYLLVILLIGIVIRLWSLYNLNRYGQNEKRKISPPEMSLQQTAHYFSIQTETLQKWRDNRRTVLHFDDLGNVTLKPTGLVPSTAKDSS
ncbi:MAG: poly-beta-1,6-N-acetyl-D-glucosamine biosynthesis protein PgaD [Deltaproteobacteria bacterium]|nr:poly-beta-1,6-N-acetyl-D-glucosamine biosynthesis protein PgaD [Deltaproteobacteria bacterium]